MVASWIGIGAVLWALGLGASPAPLSASCAEACYQQKSTAYQSCRGIPPTQRTERRRCFREADEALKRCLRRCR